MITKRLLLAIVCLLIATPLSACPSDSEVGKDLKTGKTTGGNGPRLGERSPSAKPSPTAEQPKVTTSAPPPKASPPPAAPPFVIKISSDTSGTPPFDPRSAQVTRGTVVRWTNTDSVPHSVKANNNAFVSPSIPPGGSFDYKADAAGTFDYVDGTRPYAVGTLEVA